MYIHIVNFFFNLHYLFIYFWLCWVFVCVRGLSVVAASGGHYSSWCAGLSLSRPLVAEHRLQTRRLSSCGSQAQLLCGMWDLPRAGLEPMSPALAGGLSTTAPPGKPLFVWFCFYHFSWVLFVCLFVSFFKLLLLLFICLFLSLLFVFSSVSLFVFFLPLFFFSTPCGLWHISSPARSQA